MLSWEIMRLNKKLHLNLTKTRQSKNSNFTAEPCFILLNLITYYFEKAPQQTFHKLNFIQAFNKLTL